MNGVRTRSRRRAGVLGGLVGGLLLPAVAPPGGAAQAPGDTRAVEIPGTGQVVTLAWVPAGTFAWGSPDGEAGRDPDEGPVRQVRLPGFWMTVHEITADQYAPFRFASFDSGAAADPEAFDVDAVTRPSPPYEDPGHGLPAGDHPATGMTRLNALHYARWLSLKTGRLFRLPTEAEWEYACRAGSEGAFGEGGPDELETRAWYDANAAGGHHPVGTKTPNAWGLHDLQGNVAEWVLDGYEPDARADLPADAAVESPRFGDPVGGRGVVRGGAFDDPPGRLRCAERLPEAAAWKRRDPQIPKSRWWNTDSPHVGFRLVSPGGERSVEEILVWFDGVLGG